MHHPTVNIRRWFAGFFLCLFLGFSCGKGEDAPAPSNPCNGTTITVTAAITNAGLAQSNGKIEASATGGTGTPTFSINGGAFQSTGIFANLAKGSYTVTSKYPNGCNGSAVFTVNENDPCSSTITLTASSTQSDSCSASGVVTASAGGSTGFTYSIDNGAFQTSNVFNNISVGNHTIIAKDNNGCSKTATVNITSLPSGPMFKAVKSIIVANCALAGCHGGAQSPNFTNDCNIVVNSARIKARAVDGQPSFMPPSGPLPQADRDKIANWVNAGGKFTD